MPTLTPAQAKDEIYTIVNVGTRNYIDGIGLDCQLRFQGKENPESTPACYVRFSLQTVLSPLKAYAVKDEGSNSRIYETAGLFFASVNIEMSVADSFRTGDLLATAIRDMVRDVDTPLGVWLRNARLNELPSDGQYYKWNVVAEYEYDEAG